MTRSLLTFPPLSWYWVGNWPHYHIKVLLKADPFTSWQGQYWSILCRAGKRWCGRTRRKEGKRDVEEKDSWQHHMRLAVLRADHFTSWQGQYWSFLSWAGTWRCGRTRREEGKRDVEKKNSLQHHMRLTVLSADPFTSLQGQYWPFLRWSRTRRCRRTRREEGKRDKEEKDSWQSHHVQVVLVPSFHDKANTDLSSAELVLGGVGGREEKKAGETRKRKKAGTAISYR